METGLLESLRKYRPREGKDPLENFITEAFAWILNNYSDFAEFFINKYANNFIFYICLIHVRPSNHPLTKSLTNHENHKP